MSETRETLRASEVLPANRSFRVSEYLPNVDDQEGIGTYQIVTDNGEVRYVSELDLTRLQFNLELWRSIGDNYLKISQNIYSEQPDKFVSRLKRRSRAASAAAAKARARKGGVRIGMTTNQVLASNWGRPRSVNRTVTARGTTEQWVYGDGNYLYFEDGVLVTIQN
jgi:hypothetical protein